MPTLWPTPLAATPIDEIWIDAARALGFVVTRTLDAYASSDGRGNIFIGVSEILDVDDTVAQLIFHELCHALVEGPERQTFPDWGLDNTGAGDVTREHACLRLQAHLAGPHGLRASMAPTTEYRAYHDKMPADTLAPDEDPATSLARDAAARAAAAPWRDVLTAALTQTAGLLHPLGFALGPTGETCGSCAWLYVGGRGPAVERCRQAANREGTAPRTRGDHPACDRWEAPVDCRTCGACCREAYHAVSVSMREAVVWRQPALVVRHGHRFEILRAGDRCSALSTQTEGSQPRHSCTIYEDRPQTCRDFAAGGRHCLDARRRVGLSR